MLFTVTFDLFLLCFTVAAQAWFFIYHLGAFMHIVILIWMQCKPYWIDLISSPYFSDIRYDLKMNSLYRYVFVWFSKLFHLIDDCLLRRFQHPSTMSTFVAADNDSRTIRSHLSKWGWAQPQCHLAAAHLLKFGLFQPYAPVRDVTLQ